ncbi:MAG: NAD-dependent epimerase/dehydratase family protein [Pseudomonadota bacterium]
MTCPGRLARALSHAAIDQEPPRRILITGTAGFIGFHLARTLLTQGHAVHGFDGITDYYDVTLKRARHDVLRQSPDFAASEGLLEDRALFDRTADSFRPDIIVHLAGQAGVRHSLDHPRAYIDSNVIDSFNVMETARRHGVAHLLMASSSSVYGANTSMPFAEVDKADTQLTIYGATKKASESIGHAYAHLHDLPTTLFRFFTVYGPWGRPDLAFFKFADAILDGRPIDIYNHGQMYRDFTYLDDLVQGIRLLIDAVPERLASADAIAKDDSLSPVAPYRVVNIGNSTKVRLLDFIDALETSLGQKAVRNYMDMQPGDLEATWANVGLLHQLTGYRPQTDVQTGIDAFVRWFRDYYGK